MINESMVNEEMNAVIEKYFEERFNGAIVVKEYVAVEGVPRAFLVRVIDESGEIEAETYVIIPQEDGTFIVDEDYGQGDEDSITKCDTMEEAIDYAVEAWS